MIETYTNSLKQLQTKTYLKTLIAISISALTAMAPVFSRTAYNIFVNLNNTIGSHSILSIILIFSLIIFSSTRLAMAKTKSETLAWFIFIPVLLGFFTSFIFFMYSLGSIAIVFLMTSVYFIVLTLFSYFTKTDFTKYSKILFVSLISLLIVSLIGILFTVGWLNILISMFAIVLFSFYTVHDNQQMVKYVEENNGSDSDNFEKISYVFAISLYLDFINLFNNLIRLFGR